MGNSIQDYRLQIGLHNGLFISYKYKSNCSAARTGRMNSNTKIFVSLLLMGLSLSLAILLCRTTIINEIEPCYRNTCEINGLSFPLRSSFLQKSSHVKDYNF